jgi:hypothetical protein
MKRRHLLFAFVFGFALGIVPAGCGNGDEEVDCFQLCRNYDDCVSSIDVNECTSTCSVDVGLFEREARLCQQCIGNLGCGDQATCWAPGGDCVDFVAFVVRNDGFPDD